jgi:peptidoglycan/LPS O-acetylase OafA/YrhL
MQKKVYFQNLDAIRFIAALMVFLSHELDQLFSLSHIKFSFLGRLWDLIACGYLGVYMFFVLSGFLITYILLKEKELTNHINVKNFYFRRILRIWPLYFLILLISFGIIPYTTHMTEIINTTAQRLPYYLSFLSNFDMLHQDKFQQGQGNGAVVFMQTTTWSVSIEEQFYLVLPLLFLLVKPRYYASIFITAIIGSIAFRLYNCNDGLVLAYHTFSVVVYLAIGGLSAYLVLKRQSFLNFFSGIPPWVSFLIYLGGFIILLYRVDLMGTSPYVRVFLPLFYGAFFAFVILDQNYSQQCFLKLGRSKFLTFWGKYSYGIYLLHPVVMGIVKYFIIRENIIETTFLNYLAIGIIALILTLAVSYLSYELFEKRFLTLKRKFSVIVKE